MFEEAELVASPQRSRDSAPGFELLCVLIWCPESGERVGQEPPWLWCRQVEHYRGSGGVGCSSGEQLGGSGCSLSLTRETEGDAGKNSCRRTTGEVR
jgi:hypothetical protein